MARKQAKKPSRRRKQAPTRRDRALAVARRAVRWAGIALAGAAALLLLLIILFRFVNPPGGPYMAAEAWRHGTIRHDWVNISDVPGFVPRSLVAAEDANFCLHWGFDVRAIRAAIEEGEGRGASTISQQVAKNLFLWHGRSWLRKALEAPITLAIEALWPKRRIIEVYMNIAEFDSGVFGVAAAGRAYFNTAPDRLNASQAARLAAVLPNPKGRNARSANLTRRAARIRDGAATIDADGRAACFQD